MTNYSSCRLATITKAVQKERGFAVKIPRIVLAGTHSGVGKTTIATGIMAYLTGQGYKVQPYKVGPDYIDPSYHTYATGKHSRNLDLWLSGEEQLLKLFAASGQDCDYAIIEGVMGLYDGHQNPKYKSSTAEIAKLLDAPVILIVNVHSMAQSAGAVVLGYKAMDPGLNLAGVIVNKVSGRRHFEMVKQSIEEHANVPVIGFIGRHQEIILPERHLGLIPVTERSELQEHFAALADRVAENIDFRQLAQIADSAKDMALVPPPKHRGQKKRVKVAVAQDEAFSFYYQDALDYMADLGVEWVPFSPLRDPSLPAGSSGVFIGGGFPELFLAQLSANKKLQTDLLGQAKHGIPLYAECGGLMYLCQEIEDFEGNNYPLVGIVPAKVKMGKRLVQMGYKEFVAVRDSILAQAGDRIRGHEFHYSALMPTSEAYPWAYRYCDDSGNTKYEGYACRNILASYLHCHLAGSPYAETFVNSCRQYAPAS